MVLTEPHDSRAELPPGMVVRLVDGAADDLASIQAVQAVAFATMGTAVGDADVETLAAAKAAVEPARVEFLRERLRRQHTVIAAAVDASGQPSAVGMHQPVGAVTELVGVATVPARRRRGLGTAVTAALVADAHSRGMTTVFLSAGDPAVARIYEAVGFTTVGTAQVAQPHR
jgi:N-acetylglutamate synthase-like GNAT family acetyltransferase